MKLDLLKAIIAIEISVLERWRKLKALAVARQEILRVGIVLTLRVTVTHAGGKNRMFKIIMLLFIIVFLGMLFVDTLDKLRKL